MREFLADQWELLIIGSASVLFGTVFAYLWTVSA